MHVVIVADVGRARFFSADAEIKGLEEVADLINPAARLRGADVFTDGHGRRQGASLTPHTQRKDAIANEFAGEVADRALELIDRGERYIIVAPPNFLGRLRRALPERILQRVVASIDKDLTKVTIHEMGDAVRRNLPPTSGMPPHG